MDPVRSAIMANRFSAIVEEASATAYRTAHTNFVKVNQDYQCALATPEGEMFAYPYQSGVTVFIGLPLRHTIDLVGRDNMEPGDVIITNDPFRTDGMVTHMMDMNMIMPIFHQDVLVGFGWAFIHSSDIGGAVPGSISPTNAECFQEGIRIRPSKLYRRGELNQELVDLFLDNCRIPEEVWGDFKAMISAMKSMGRRLVDLCDLYGREDVLAGMEEVMDFTESKARNAIGQIPDGTYSFTDYLEGPEAGQYVFLKATMSVAGDEMTLDFTGTDPQQPAAFNFICGGRTHPYVTQAVNNYILTQEPDAPKNAGLLRPIRTIAPRGTVINADFPAAMGTRAVTATRLYDATMGCLNQAVPGGLVTAGAGMAGIIVAAARDPLTGRRKVGVLNPICGGGGGRLNGDGVDGVDGRFGALKSTPAETIEVETAIRVRQYQLVPDTFGPGRHRGGAAVVMDLENTDVSATMTVRGMNRFDFRPWGLGGGRAGHLGRVVLNPGRDDEREIGKINVLTLRRGDLVRMITPSGGGFGDPLARDPERVRTDVRGGLLTAPTARADYGVVIAGGDVDGAATADLRVSMAAERGAPQDFDFGPERQAYDRIWPPQVRALLATMILAEDLGVRPHLLAAVRDRLTAAGQPVDEATLRRSIEAEWQRLVGAPRAA